MYWLSESGENLIQKCNQKTVSTASIDTLVVGSGYGGAVAALRFSEAGIPVYVLERGEEYVAGEFPNDVSQIGKHMRADTLSPNGVSSSGYENALFDIRLGAGIGALVGNGLGGGSLINAGVGVVPDSRVFEQESWPSAIRQENLAPFFQKAEETLELQTSGAPKPNHTQPNDPTATAKFKTIQDIGLHSQLAASKDSNLEIKFKAVPIAVQLDSDPSQNLGKREVCKGCGDCVTGCNHDAKLNLTKTYLPRAKKNGARIFTGLSVLHVLANTDSDKTEFPWIVSYVRTSERKAQHQALKTEASQQLSHTNQADWIYSIKAKRVILSAGTFGTTEIMLRSRAKGLQISNSALGVNVSGNGDDVSFAYDMSKPANAVGWGAKKRSEYIGPTITGGVFIKDKTDHRNSTLIEDGGAPGLINQLFGELTKTLGIFVQLENLNFRATKGKDGLAVDPNEVKHSMPMLGMGHDSASGVIILDPISDRVSIAWTNKETEVSTTLHNKRQSIIKKLGGIFIQNPATSIIPESMSSVLSGPKLNGNLFTVHPLGGCRMADNVFTGVVNHWGAVYKQDNQAIDHLHDGLYIMDGSIMPSSLGVNPMMTITALAERACEKILLGIQKSPANSFELPPYPSTPLYEDHGLAATTRLSEVLRAEDAWLAPSLKQALGIPAAQIKCPVALFVEMQINDWDKLLLSTDHKVEVIPTSITQGRFSRSRLVIDKQDQNGTVSTLELKVEEGTVQLFSRKKSCFFPIIRFMQIGLTYALGRWLPDIIKSNAPKSSISKKIKLFADALKLIRHSLEQREFVYRITLCHQEKKYQLTGTKLITPEASWQEIFSTIKALALHGKIPAMNRRSVWEQLTQIDITLSDCNKQKVLSTRLTMDFPEMFRRFNPQLGIGRDTFTALFEFTTYPMLMLRHILKTRTLDFRLPDYAENLPFVDPATIKKPAGYFELNHLENDKKFPTIQTTRGIISPEIHGPIEVDFDFESDEKLKIGLVRYKQTSLSVQANTESTGFNKVKSIIFLNGLALSTHAFVAQELGNHGSNSLAAKFYSEGWDVWLMEYRASPLLDASAKYSSIDAIASFDMPKSVDYVIEAVSKELSLPFDKTQVFCFSHCIGSASLAMSLLSSKLKHHNGTSKLAGCLFSQFQTFLVGSRTTQMRLQLASFLRNATGLDFVNFTSGQAQANGLHALFDRFFSSMNYGKENAFQNERCPHEHHLSELQPDSTTCKRMTGIFGRSIVHENLAPETHKKLDLYFGRANIGVFLHGAKCVEYERLVDLNGQNVYLSDANIQENIDMPIMLLHGSENVLFNVESYWLSIKNFQRVFGKHRNDQHLDQYLLAKGYAHFDCTAGKNAHRDIFQPAIHFFEKAFQHSLKVKENVQYVYQPRLPITGPIIGDIQHQADGTTVKIWVEVDNTRTGHQDDNIVITKTTIGDDYQYDTWGLQQYDLESSNQRKSAINIAIAEIEIPTAQIDHIKIEAICLSRVLSNGVTTDPYHGALNEVWATGRRYASQTADAASMALLEQLFDEVKTYINPKSNLANQANPGTLSRKKTEIRTENFYVAKLNASQLSETPQQLHFIAAACRHPGFTGLESDRSDHSLLQLSGSIQFNHEKPAFMLMLGDQIYSDARAGVFDQATIIEKLVPRYRAAFGSDGFRSLATQLPLYMVIDDHEIHDNWSKESVTSNEALSLFNNGMASYSAYQRSHGPTPISSNTGAFDYALVKAGYHFLVLDSRTQRQRAPERKILNDAQWAMLDAWLDQVKSNSQPKFIVTGSVVVPGLIENADLPSPRQADSWQVCEADRQRLFEMIAAKAVNNIVFISSDYHCAGYSEINYSHHENLHSYAIVAPPLHAPMRFANAEANTVLANEQLDLGLNGVVQVNTTAFDGEGWVEIKLQQISPTTHQIALSFKNKELDNTNFNSREIIWSLT